jgi:hypothetical protein
VNPDATGGGYGPAVAAVTSTGTSPGISTDAETTASACCAACQHRAGDRQVLEQRIAGLVVFSSGFGASVASSRLCRLHDRLVSPRDTCGHFQAHSAQRAQQSAQRSGQ